MEVEGYLIASTLKIILSQRLIRQLCTNCRVEHQLDPQEIAWLDSAAIDNFMNLQFYTAEGCTKCNNTGYSGRVSIYEVLEPDAAMLQALRKEDHDAFINAAGARDDVKSLGLRALDLALEGKTSLDEVIRVAGELEDD